jgi:hypothetical protein
MRCVTIHFDVRYSKVDCIGIVDSADYALRENGKGAFHIPKRTVRFPTFLFCERLRIQLQLRSLVTNNCCTCAMAAATKTALQLLEEKLATYEAELITRSAALDAANLTGDATKKQDAKEAYDRAERMYNSLVAQIKEEKERLAKEKERVQGEFPRLFI